MRTSYAVLLLTILLAVLVGTVGATELTLYPANESDGHISRESADSTYAAIHDGAGTNVDSSGAFFYPEIRTSAGSNTWWKIRRVALTFPTEDIPDNAIINSASLFMRCDGTTAVDLGDMGVGITKFTPDGTLSADDFDNFGSVRYATDHNISTLSGSPDTEWELNSLAISNISLVASSGFGARLSYDIDNTSPGWISSVNSFAFFRSADGMNFRPRLVVNYSIPYEYYAYGDSITRATGGGDLDASGSDVYIIQMNKTHDSGNLSEHNQDGGSMTSAWALGNYSTHPGTPYPKKVFMMFGANDRILGYSGTWTADNLKLIAQNYTAQGSSPYVLLSVLLRPLSDPDNSTYEWVHYNNQYDNITIIQNYLAGNSTNVVKMYDAIDSNPRNGVPDQVNVSLMYDYVHPNKEGHRLMGEYLWDYLQGNTSIDTGAPQPISNLANSTPTCNAVTFSWDLPSPSWDLGGVGILINGTWNNATNTSTSKALTGLPNNTVILFNSTTVDLSGNQNLTHWQNTSATTADFCVDNPRTHPQIWNWYCPAGRFCFGPFVLWDIAPMALA